MQVKRCYSSICSVCMSQHSWKGDAAFPPECGCQWASLSPAVWQDAGIISGDGGGERGSRKEESKEEEKKKGKRGSGCVREAGGVS